GGKRTLIEGGPFADIATAHDQLRLHAGRQVRGGSEERGPWLWLLNENDAYGFIIQGGEMVKGYAIINVPTKGTKSMVFRSLEKASVPNPLSGLRVAPSTEAAAGEPEAETRDSISRAALRLLKRTRMLRSAERAGSIRGVPLGWALEEK